MFWTLEKIQEAYKRNYSAEEATLPHEQLNELLSIAEDMLKIVKASQQYRAKWPVDVYTWPEYVEKLDSIINEYPEMEGA